MFLGYPLFIATPHLAFQVVDAGDVADRLADLVDAGPCERALDFGGPEVLGIRDRAASRQRITHQRARLLRVPRIGFLRDFDDGQHLCPDHRTGRTTWNEWLSEAASPTSTQ